MVIDELKNIPEMNIVSFDNAVRNAQSQIERARRKGHRHVHLRVRDAAALRHGWKNGNSRQRACLLVDTVERWIVEHVTSRLVGEVA